MKKIGYYLFAFFFTIFRLFPLRKEQVFFVATHDDSAEGNIGIVSAALRERKPEWRQYFLTGRDGIHHPFSFFIGKAYQMATSGTIFLDNEFMPMAYTPIHPKAKVVQLWHGTGSVKKFGLDAETGEVARLAAKANQKLTHLIVNSEKTKQQYAGAFGISKDKIYILGLPRTDLILDEEAMSAKREEFYKQFPELRGKMCVLYAPTFRDDEVENPKVALDLERMQKMLAWEDAMLLRLHPHVAENFTEDSLGAGEDKKIWNMSGYPGVTTLLAVADCLITDYSSIIYEYCLFRRPMIFYAYDFQEFRERGRNFYEDYESYVPGPVIRNQEELENLWQSGFDWEEKVEKFREETYQYLDKNAVNRLLELIFGT